MTLKGFWETVKRWFCRDRRRRKTDPKHGAVSGLRLFWPLGVLALVVACDSTIPSGEKPGDIVMVELIGPNDTIPGTASYRVAAVRIAPPVEYAVWYSEVERCAGMRGDFLAVAWYLVPLPWKGPNGGTVYGQHGGDRIILNALMAGEVVSVKHEQMHDVLERNGLNEASMTHDDRYFNMRCLADGPAGDG